ncbi:hypothetical protein [Propionicimonas sp.]|uniref:hypothetical protein n=1 Tax=Propionicimonas sp. TaxID=1955623 RepID=UPI0039E48C90
MAKSATESPPCASWWWRPRRTTNRRRRNPITEDLSPSAARKILRETRRGADRYKAELEATQAELKARQERKEQEEAILADLARVQADYLELVRESLSLDHLGGDAELANMLSGDAEQMLAQATKLGRLTS